jgi:hypothetical protein
MLITGIVLIIIVMKQNELAYPTLQDYLPAAVKRLMAARFTKPVDAGSSFSPKVALTAVVFMMCLVSADAANWYVRPSAAGSNNGTSWANAWSMSSLNSNWASVKPGDTVWLAGGTYTTGMHCTQSGAAGSVISIMRPRTTDAAPTASAGWSASFDSQVIVDPGNSSDPVWWDKLNAGSYLTFDGRVDSGIRFYVDPSATYNLPGAVAFRPGCGGQTNITFSNIDMAGPQPSSAQYNQPASTSPLLVFTYNGSTYLTISNILIQHCRLHGGVDCVNSTGLINSTIQYSQLYDTSSSNSAYHSNFMELHNSGNITFRYNNVHDWQVEGFFFLSAGPSGASTWWIYGNVFHDCSNVVGRIMELEGGNNQVNGPIYVYNNTFYNVPLAIFSGAGSSPGSYATSSSAMNNIFWDCGGVFQRWNGTHDYNYYGGGNSVEGGEAHGVNGAGASTFVQPVGDTNANFQIVSTVASNYPRNKGAVLTSNGFINVDMLGTTRGSDGAWDIGAYEYGSATTPPAVQNLHIQ